MWNYFVVALENVSKTFINITKTDTQQFETHAIFCMRNDLDNYVSVHVLNYL